MYSTVRVRARTDRTNQVVYSSVYQVVYSLQLKNPSSDISDYFMRYPFGLAARMLTFWHAISFARGASAFCRLAERLAERHLPFAPARLGSLVHHDKENLALFH